MFSFACTHTSFSRFPHSKSTKQQFHEYNFVYMYTQLRSRGKIFTNETELSVPLRCFLLLVDFSRAILFAFFLVYLWQKPQSRLHEESLMATTSILILRFLIVLTFHLLPSRHIFILFAFPIIIIIFCYPYHQTCPIIFKTCVWQHRFRFLPAKKVNMRDTQNFSLFDTHAFYMIKKMKNSVIYTQSARPLFAPCLFYLKQYRVFLSLLKARRWTLVVKATYVEPATINKALNK